MSSRTTSTTIGRSHGEERRKPPIPTFTSVKSKSKIDATKATEAKNKDQAEVKSDHLKGDEAKNGGESPSEPVSRVNSTNTTIHKLGKDEKAEVKKTVVKTKEVPSRYMTTSKASPRPTTATTPTTTVERKPAIPKAHTPTPTTSSGMRTKTPERNAKTPTKLQPGIVIPTKQNEYISNTFFVHQRKT